MNTATAAKFSEVDAAKILGCNVKSFRSRMVALGLTKVCGRCGGDGRYSYNPMDGDRCFGCLGSGKRLLPVTKALASDMKRRQDAGELDGYFARNAARAAAKARIAPLAAEADALYMPIANAYTAAANAARSIEQTHEFVNSSVIFRAQGMANAIRWGNLGDSLQTMGVSGITHAVDKGRADYEQAAVEMAERVEMLRTLRAAFDAM